MTKKNFIFTVFCLNYYLFLHQNSSIMELRIKEIARQKKMPAKEIAKKLGISPSALSQSMTGKMSLDRLEEIAGILDVPARELIREDENSIICPNCGKKFTME